MTALARLHSALRRFCRAETGSVAVEFAIVLPLYLTIMLSSLEAGITAVRVVMLERALDLTVRDLRIGTLGSNPDHARVHQRMCSHMSMMENCRTDLKLEMRVIDRVNWTGFTTAPTCVNRAVALQPSLEFSQGGSNEVVTVRACAVYDVLFPTTHWGLGLKLDPTGGYQASVISAFVNEPR